MNADFAATCPWEGVLNKPASLTQAADISTLKAQGYVVGDLPTWNGKKFIPIKRSNLFDTSKLYGDSNKPYIITRFTWEPGTITPFLRTSQTFTLLGVAEGSAVLLGLPYDLEGIAATWALEPDSVIVTLFNQTPYDITIPETSWSILVMK